MDSFRDLSDDVWAKITGCADFDFQKKAEENESEMHLCTLLVGRASKPDRQTERERAKLEDLVAACVQQPHKIQSVSLDPPRSTGSQW